MPTQHETIVSLQCQEETSVAFQKRRKAKNRRAKGQALRSRIAVIEKYERTYVKPQQTAPQ